MATHLGHAGTKATCERLTRCYLGRALRLSMTDYTLHGRVFELDLGLRRSVGAVPNPETEAQIEGAVNLWRATRGAQLWPRWGSLWVC